LFFFFIIIIIIIAHLTTGPTERGAKLRQQLVPLFRILVAEALARSQV
jgi:hypothetical protein